MDIADIGPSLLNKKFNQNVERKVFGYGRVIHETGE